LLQLNLSELYFLEWQRVPRLQWEGLACALAAYSLVACSWAAASYLTVVNSCSNSDVLVVAERTC